MEAMEINHSTNSPLQSEALDPGEYNLSAGTGAGLEVGSWNGCYAWQYLKNNAKQSIPGCCYFSKIHFKKLVSQEN